MFFSSFFLQNKTKLVLHQNYYVLCNYLFIKIPLLRSMIYTAITTGGSSPAKIAMGIIQLLYTVTLCVVA